MSLMKLNSDPDLIRYGDTDFGDPMIFDNTPFSHRRTTVIATIANPEITSVDLQKLMEAGMNVARFLTSFSTNTDKIRLISKVDRATRTLAKKHGLLEWPCATCMALKTCVVKTGILKADCPSIMIKENDEVTLSYNLAEFDACNEKRIFVDNPHLTDDSEIGMEVSIRQDTIILKIEKIYQNYVKCVVIKGGPLRSMESVCMRGAKRTRPYLTKKDLELVKLAVEYQVDMLIVNYVRHVETIKKIKKYVGTSFKRPFIVSGISTHEGLRNIDDIIKESDAVLISREFLAYELERKLANRMGRIQKWIVGKCHQLGKPVFISGQIFYNMFETGLSSHQDIADAANALLEGVSGFILRPCNDMERVLNVMRQLSELCTEMEPFTNDKIDFQRTVTELSMPVNAAVAAAMSCALVANETQACIIVIPTVSGRTVYYLNWLRPLCVVIAVTTKISTFRLLHVHRSVVPLMYKGAPRRTWDRTVKARIDFAIAYAVEKNWIQYGGYYITLEKGLERSSFCDTVRIYTVQTKKSHKIECSADSVSRLID